MCDNKAIISDNNDDNNKSNDEEDFSKKLFLEESFIENNDYEEDTQEQQQQQQYQSYSINNEFDPATSSRSYNLNDKAIQQRIKFPQNDQKRRFIFDWYSQYSWLDFKNAVFCLPCRKFGNDHGYSDETFIKTGFNNWILLEKNTLDLMSFEILPPLNILISLRHCKI